MKIITALLTKNEINFRCIKQHSFLFSSATFVARLRAAFNFFAAVSCEFYKTLRFTANYDSFNHRIQCTKLCSETLRILSTPTASSFYAVSRHAGKK